MKPVLTVFFPVSLIVTIFGAFSINAAGRDVNTKINTAVATCTQRGSTCTAKANAVGDVVEFDVNTATAKDLGTIKDETKVDIDLPKNVGEKLLYSLTPTTGESKDTQVYLLFVNKEQPAGTRLAGKSVVIVYRQFAGEKTNKWVEVGIVSNDKPLSLAEATLMPDGVAKVPNPKNPTEPVIFNLGKKNFNA